MRGARLTRVALGLLAASTTAACQRGEERFVGGLHAFAMTTDTPPAYVTEGGALYVVERRVAMPLAAPSDAALDALELPEGSALPFPRLPVVERRDLAIEIDFALRRVAADGGEAAPVAVDVLVNGANEFHEYEPGFLVDGAGIVPNLAGWERRFELAPGEAVVRTVREQELDEVAVDLATLVNGAPNPNEVVAPDSVSDRDPRVAPFVPSVVPGLVAVRLGLRTEVAADLVLEATVRVRDRADRLADGGEPRWALEPPPRVFTADDLARGLFP